MRRMDIRQLVAAFTERLHEAVDAISVTRAREAVMHALGEKRGRLPKGMAAILGRKPRRKGPRQLCPVPGCKNPAAPVFGMVCGDHKDVSKRKIKQYREARRAAKLGAKANDRAAAAPKRRARRAKRAANPGGKKTAGRPTTRSPAAVPAQSSAAAAKPAAPKLAPVPPAQIASAAP